MNKNGPKILIGKSYTSKIKNSLNTKANISKNLKSKFINKGPQKKKFIIQDKKKLNYSKTLKQKFDFTSSKYGKSKKKSNKKIFGTKISKKKKPPKRIILTDITDRGSLMKILRRNIHLRRIKRHRLENQSTDLWGNTKKTKKVFSFLRRPKFKFQRRHLVKYRLKSSNFVYYKRLEYFFNNIRAFKKGYRQIFGNIRNHEMRKNMYLVTDHLYRKQNVLIKFLAVTEALLPVALLRLKLVPNVKVGKQFIKHGLVSINKKVIRYTNYKLSLNDIIELHPRLAKCYKRRSWKNHNIENKKRTDLKLYDKTVFRRGLLKRLYVNYNQHKYTSVYNKRSLTIRPKFFLFSKKLRKAVFIRLPKLVDILQNSTTFTLRSFMVLLHNYRYSKY